MELQLNPEVSQTAEKFTNTKQWFVLCTLKNQEQKVTDQLTKKGIEYYCPFTYREEKVVSRTVKSYAPLLPGQVFVYTHAANLHACTRISGVVSLMYWKSTPAVISPEEINAVRMMCDNYLSVQTEKTTVNANEMVRVMEKSASGYSNQVLSIRHQGLTVVLPGLGLKLTAGREETDQLQRQVKLVKERTRVKRLNPLAFFGL